MALNRECTTIYEGHQIVFYLGYTGWPLSSVSLKLYIDGCSVDEKVVSVFVTGQIILRGQLQTNPGRTEIVEAVADLGMWRLRPIYQIKVGEQVVHQERGAWHSI